MNYTDQELNYTIDEFIALKREHDKLKSVNGFLIQKLSTCHGTISKFKQLAICAVASLNGTADPDPLQGTPPEALQWIIKHAGVL